MSLKTRQFARFFNSRGYILVATDVRGRGDSDGMFEPYRNDGQDVYDAIEWCAAQAWSNARDTDFMEKLIDVWPNGFAQRLNDGMARARFHEGTDKPFADCAAQVLTNFSRDARNACNQGGSADCSCRTLTTRQNHQPPVFQYGGQSPVG